MCVRALVCVSLRLITVCFLLRVGAEWGLGYEILMPKRDTATTKMYDCGLGKGSVDTRDVKVRMRMCSRHVCKYCLVA